RLLVGDCGLARSEGLAEHRWPRRDAARFADRTIGRHSECAAAPDRKIVGKARVGDGGIVVRLAVRFCPRGKVRHMRECFLPAVVFPDGYQNLVSARFSWGWRRGTWRRPCRGRSRAVAGGRDGACARGDKQLWRMAAVVASTGPLDR